MNDKISFAEFIAAKRKEAGLTQGQMAEKLFVTDTAISKWERGLSYPDITLISPICRLLQISEHEFITATEDTAGRREKEEARKYRKIAATTKLIILLTYSLAVLTCFICNLAVNHTLSWFFIVLFSLGLGFSVLTLPMFIEREKWLICSGAATGSLFVLLFVIYAVNGTLSWFFPAVLIALPPVALYWLCLCFVRFVPISKWYKAGFISFAAALLCMLNFYVAAIEGYSTDYTISAILNPFWWANLPDYALSNKIVFWSIMLVAVVFAAVGALTHKKQPQKIK